MISLILCKGMKYMAKKIILDTDPGIDDAMALLFAEAHPDIEMIGITTVFGNATIENSTRNAQFLKDKFQFTCDIAKGAEKPCEREPVGPSSDVHGEEGFGDVDVSGANITGISNKPAYQYIIDTLREYPNEITLVAVGPLTNLALALDEEESITSLVKEVVVMGGAFGLNNHRGNVTPYAEANIHDDPHAAQKVFSANWPISIIGLDVTESSVFDDPYFIALKEEAGQVGEFIWDISRFYLKFYASVLGFNGCHVHDPSAVACVVQPDLFEFEVGAIEVTTSGERQGMTTLVKEDSSQGKAIQKVAAKVNTKALLAMYREKVVDFGKNFKESDIKMLRS